jgi:hypothetical protein
MADHTLIAKIDNRLKERPQPQPEVPRRRALAILIERAVFSVSATLK